MSDTIARANWFTAPGQMIASQVEKMKIRMEAIEPAATVAFAGVAEDRTSKVVVTAGAVGMITGVMVGSKILAVTGAGAFMYGFVRGFKKAMTHVGDE